MREIIQVTSKATSAILRQVSHPVDVVDYTIDDLADEMKFHLESHVGAVGLAAIQLGVPVRMIALKMNIRSDACQEVVFVLNPVIKLRGKEIIHGEGCLSINYGRSVIPVRRNNMVKVNGFNLDMQPVTYRERDLMAFVFQHEIDHLDGKLIVNW
jgi:peptide deformylase